VVDDAAHVRMQNARGPGSVLRLLLWPLRLHQARSRHDRSAGTAGQTMSAGAVVLLSNTSRMGGSNIRA